MTPEQAEDIAWALDVLSDLTRVLLEPLASMDSMNADAVDVTIRLTKDDRPMTPEEARKLVEWVDGTEMQDDLRALFQHAEANRGD